MDIKEVIVSFWNDMGKQNWSNLNSYFSEDAVINWNNTNERFNVDEFVAVNQEYPGSWAIDLKRIECIANLVISVVQMELKNENISCHCVSFFEFNDGKVKLLNEYWGDDGEAPEWRIKKQIGRPIE